MNNNGNLKLVISYSHLDEENIKDFQKHIAPLKNNGFIKDWYDRKIVAGQDFQDNIDNNFETADIVCLFISANFLSSIACMKEKKKALEFRKRRRIAIVPIILCSCGWLDDHDISTLLALPTDGKPISEFSDPNKAWNDVYEGLKAVIKKEIIVRQLEITEHFSLFLQNTDLLSKAHSQKDKVLLQDIFVYPELAKFDDLGEYEKKSTSSTLHDNYFKYPKLLLAGESQSGKTTLCKKLFIDLRQKNYVPIYISENINRGLGKLENIISRAFKEQYKTVPMEEIDKQRFVLIIDDFHFVKNKEEYISDLSSYPQQIVVVDDIFGLNLKNTNVTKRFARFKIKEFIPSLRNQLINKWIHLTDKDGDGSHNKNKIYEHIDTTTEFVNAALGKLIGSGIMPAYPFFILSVISIYETFEKPLDQEITSQGYCYQALIYMYLRKQGVTNDEIDTYINFLTEFSFFIYQTTKNELSIDEFNSFMKLYYDKYNLPIKQETLLRNLQQTQILSLDSFNNYSFCYQYLYYYFVAKYLADHVDNNKDIIDSIISNLHKDENAYIAIFISHHSKNAYILDEIILNAFTVFDKYKPATLSKEELSFFDAQVDNIVKAVLPPASITPEQERDNRLRKQDTAEQSSGDKTKFVKSDESELATELRRSIKMVEVMGIIIKNRSGSLEKAKLEFIFEGAMKVHLRILSTFFEIIRNEEKQQEIVNFISDRLNKIIEDKKLEYEENKKKPKELNREKLEKLSKTIFWGMNFFVVYGFINKIIHSLGSNKLTAIVEKVCNSENTPASFLLKHGILMWYNKNVQIDNIANEIDKESYSETAKEIMKFIIVNHCSMHSVDFKDKQKIEHKLGIPSQRMLMQQSKGN